MLLPGLTACQSERMGVQDSMALMGNLSPVGTLQVSRSYTFILPSDAIVYIANPVNPLVAETGVDIISVGALTHSAPACDIGLDWV